MIGTPPFPSFHFKYILGKAKYILVRDKIDGNWNCFELIPFTSTLNNFRGKTVFL